MEVENSVTDSPDSPYRAMDRMYRYQRFFYDASRKFYLLGRDRLLNEMPVRPGDRVLEVGCGTGRNLLILAKRDPAAAFYGLDASEAMLETARSKAASSGLTNIHFVRALADDYAFKETFALERPFDTIFFSYSISMIPTWREAILNAIENLRPGGSLYIVDFYDQAGMPGWFRALLKRWLHLFHVKYPSELLPFFEELTSNKKGSLNVRELYGRYSLIIRFDL